MTVAATTASSSLPTASIAGSAATNSTTGSASSGALSFTSNFNTFLTLLTTQLQNQDPLSPMDTNTFTQQLVEFSQVEQQIDTNSNLQNLIQLQTANEDISALPLVGQTVTYNSATAPLQNGQANFSYSLPSASATTTLAVLNSQGNIVYSTAGQTAQGQYNFNWNGQNASGQTMPDGAYTLEVVATNAQGTAVNATVEAMGAVQGVSVNNGTATLNLASGITVPITELVTVNSSGGTSSGSTTTQH